MSNEKNEISSLNILYADGNDSFCQTAKKLIDSYGCQLDLAKDGAEVIDKFKLKKYDLLFVTDILPEKDAFTAVKEMRSFEGENRDKQAVIIMVSDKDETEKMEKNFDIGYDGYLIKPIKKGDLQDIFSFLTDADSEEANTEETPKEEDKITVTLDKDIESIVPEYLENIKSGGKKIPDAIAQGDFEFIYRYGHNMKGTGSSYGFAFISEVGKALEQAGTDKNIQVIKEEVEKLTEYIGKVHLVYEKQ